MTQHIIDRDASDKTKGFRLQKIRAIKHMLDEIENPRNVMFYASIEVQEDVSIVKVGDRETSTYLEEDKNYDEDTNFTPKTLRSYLREVEDRVQQNNPPTMPVITLATLHAAKGLEWERVFLMGANVGLLPLETNGFTLDARMIEEERRLFYVGMTRAKRELRISYRGKPSPFLAQAGLLTS